MTCYSNSSIPSCTIVWKTKFTHKSFSTWKVGAKFEHLMSQYNDFLCHFLPLLYAKCKWKREVWGVGAFCPNPSFSMYFCEEVWRALGCNSGNLIVVVLFVVITSLQWLVCRQWKMWGSRGSNTASLISLLFTDCLYISPVALCIYSVIFILDQPYGTCVWGGQNASFKDDETKISFLRNSSV